MSEDVLLNTVEYLVDHGIHTVTNYGDEVRVYFDGGSNKADKELADMMTDLKGVYSLTQHRGNACVTLFNSWVEENPIPQWLKDDYGIFVMH